MNISMFRFEAFRFPCSLLLLVWSGCIGVQIQGFLGFLFASTPLLYLYCHFTLLLLSRWCDVCESSSAVNEGDCFASFHSQIHLDSNYSLFRLRCFSLGQHQTTDESGDGSDSCVNPCRFPHGPDPFDLMDRGLVTSTSGRPQKGGQKKMLESSTLGRITQLGTCISRSFELVFIFWTPSQFR